MKNKNCIWIGIGVDVKKDSPLGQEILKMQELTSSKYKTAFYPEKHPHLNLFDFDIPCANLKTAIQKLETILDIQKQFSVAVTGVDFFPFGLFFIGLETNETLYDLHKKIIEAIAPLKENCLCKDYLEPHRNYTARQKELLRTYGNPHVLNQFKPHITLGFLKGQQINFKTLQNNLRGYLTILHFKIESVHIVTDDQPIRTFHLT